MNLVLSHDTAFEFWLSSLSAYKPDFGEVRQIPSHRNLTGSDTDCFWSYLSARTSLAGLYRHVGGVRTPMHVLVSRAQDRVQSDLIVGHVWGERPLPRESLFQLGEGLFVVSPELCFLQLAERHKGLPLAWLGSELCGSHAFDPRNRMMPVERPPVTTRSEIRRYLEKMAGVRGYRHASRALGPIHDRTRSPRESTVAVLLSANTKLGGQQLPPFEVNSQFDLDEASSRLTDRRYFELDMYWRKHHLCLEYNGKPHESQDAALRDLEKITALEANGTTVIPVNKRQFRTYESFEVIVGMLRKGLGVRTRASTQTESLRRAAHANLIQFEAAWRKRPPLHDYAWWRIVEPMVNFAPLG